MQYSDKILVTGSTGLAGSAILRLLLGKGYTNLIATYNKRKAGDLYPEDAIDGRCKFIKIDLLDQAAVKYLFAAENPGYVFLAAAKVGGIMANHNHRAQFIYENLQIQNNVIHHSYLSKVKKLVFLGSTCIYPTNCPQPMKEAYLMTDTLEYLSEPYGVAKIAGVKMCESYNIQYATNFIAVMPTNLYGLNDNYDLENSHFLPAFIRKMHLGKSLMQGDWEAIESDLNKYPIEGTDGHFSREIIGDKLGKYGIKQSPNDGTVSITLWGSGKPRREILHSDELADACLYIMEHIDFTDLVRESVRQYSDGIVKDEMRNTQINIGLGFDYTLFEIAFKVKEAVGFEGQVIWDRTMPDGTFQKLTNVDKLNKLGWNSKLGLDKGIKKTYFSYINRTNVLS